MDKDIKPRDSHSDQEADDQNHNVAALPIFVISMANGLERRRNMDQQLEKLGLKAEFVDAVDGRKLSAEELHQLYDEETALLRTGRVLSPAEIGCSLSHRKVYKLIMDRKLDRAIILEDDAILNQRFPAILKELRNGPLDVDVLSFYTEIGWIDLKDPLRIGAETFYRPASDVTHAVAYYITQRGARTLYEPDRISYVPDWPKYCCNMAFYVAYPVCVGHGEFQSLIGKRVETAKARRSRIRLWLERLWRISPLFYLLHYKEYENFRHYRIREKPRPFYTLFPKRYKNFFGRQDLTD